MYGAPWIEPRRSIIGMFILNYDHGSAAAVNQKLRSLNFHSTRDVAPLYNSIRRYYWSESATVIFLVNQWEVMTQGTP